MTPSKPTPAPTMMTSSEPAPATPRHRASLERLRDDLARLRWIIAFPASERSFKLLR